MDPESLTMAADLEAVCYNVQWYNFSVAECKYLEVTAKPTGGLFGWTDSVRKLDMQKNSECPQTRNQESTVTWEEVRKRYGGVTSKLVC